MENLSGVWIPIVGMMIPIVAIISGVVSQAHHSRLKTEERLAMIARGVPLAEIDHYMKTASPDTNNAQVKDPMRSLANSRRAATVLISTGFGLSIFLLIFGSILLTNISEKSGWAVIGSAAVGLIPIAIGIGFLFDYRLQKREMSRFGLEIEPESLPRS